MNLSIATDGGYLSDLFIRTDGDRDRDRDRDLYAHGIERMVYVLGFTKAFEIYPI